MLCGSSCLQITKDQSDVYSIQRMFRGRVSSITVTNIIFKRAEFIWLTKNVPLTIGLSLCIRKQLIERGCYLHAKPRPPPHTWRTHSYLWKEQTMNDQKPGFRGAKTLRNLLSKFLARHMKTFAISADGLLKWSTLRTHLLVDDSDLGHAPRTVPWLEHKQNTHSVFRLANSFWGLVRMSLICLFERS